MVHWLKRYLIIIPVTTMFCSLSYQANNNWRPSQKKRGKNTVPLASLSACTGRFHYHVALIQYTTQQHQASYAESLTAIQQGKEKRREDKSAWGGVGQRRRSSRQCGLWRSGFREGCRGGAPQDPDHWSITAASLKPSPLFRRLWPIYQLSAVVYISARPGLVHPPSPSSQHQHHLHPDRPSSTLSHQRDCLTDHACLYTLRGMSGVEWSGLWQGVCCCGCVCMRVCHK